MATQDEEICRGSIYLGFKSIQKLLEVLRDEIEDLTTTYDPTNELGIEATGHLDAAIDELLLAKDYFEQLIKD